MEKFYVEKDTRVFGFRVNTFPAGIKEAFEELLSKLPNGDTRPLYGISHCNGNEVIYIAAALETTKGEAEKYGYNTYIIERGEYMAEKIPGWLSKTDTLKEVFTKINQDPRSGSNQPAIEYYQNMEEMICMVRMNTLNDLLEAFDSTTVDLLDRLSTVPQQFVNTIPFEGSWTVGQLLQHLHKSDMGMKQILTGGLEPANRKRDQYVEKIKADFLNYEIKMRSPEFVIPDNKNFDKEPLSQSFENGREQLRETLLHADLDQICVGFPFGKLTGFEIGWFVVLHTSRHLHQLDKMISALQAKPEEIAEPTG